MKDKKQGFSASMSEFFKDSSGHFNLGTVIAIAAFAMLCRIVEKDRHPDAWTVAPFTIIVVGYFGLDTQLTRAIARSATPDTQITTGTTTIDSEQTTVTPTQTPTTTTD